MRSATLPSNSGQQRLADDAVVGVRVQPAKGARSGLKWAPEESSMKVGFSLSRITSTCWCQGAPEVSAPLLAADVQWLS